MYKVLRYYQAIFDRSHDLVADYLGDSLPELRLSLLLLYSLYIEFVSDVAEDNHFVLLLYKLNVVLLDHQKLHVLSLICIGLIE